MKRRLFRFLSVVSLVLCMATCVLWVRSYWIHDGFQWYRSRSEGFEWASLIATQGRIVISAERDNRFLTDISPPPESDSYFRAEGSKEPEWSISPLSTWRCAGLVYGRQSDVAEYPEVRIELIIPSWMPVVAAAIALACNLFRYTRGFVKGRRRDRGRCPSCGYDLRATLDRCPECGKIPVMGES